MPGPSVFISYSHKDEAWKDRLVTHLKVLQWEGLLDTWDDRRIDAGDDWYEEIQQASVEFGGHALALTLLGSLLRDAHGGDIRARREIGPLTGDLRQGGHARRVMASYATWLGPGPEVAILHLLELFDRPAPREALAALRAAPVMPGLSEALFTSPSRRGRLSFWRASEPEPLSESEWQRAVTRLRHARLLAERDPSAPDTLDAHPLVREHFGAQLKARYPAACQEAHRRLYAYYTAQAKAFPDTIEEMAPQRW